MPLAGTPRKLETPGKRLVREKRDGKSAAGPPAGKFGETASVAGSASAAVRPFEVKWTGKLCDLSRHGGETGVKG